MSFANDPVAVRAARLASFQARPERSPPSSIKSFPRRLTSGRDMAPQDRDVNDGGRRIARSKKKKLIMNL